MATERERVRRSWPIWLVSCTWPLLLPLANYIRLRQAVRTLFPTFDIGLQQKLAALTVRSLLATLLVAVVLSLLTCFVIWRRHSHAAETGLLQRVLLDVALLSAFFFSPWLEESILSGMPVRGVFGLWLGSGLFVRTIPCICAVLAGLSFRVIVSFGNWHVAEAA
jgi:uncharacterized membrane protein YdfJ with MMPL/SSD domain